MRSGGRIALHVFASGNRDYNRVGLLPPDWESRFARPESGDLLSGMAHEAPAEARAGRARKLDFNDL